MKKVIVLGKSDLSIKICKWFHYNNKYKLICVIPVIPEPFWSESLVGWCISNDIDYISSGNYNDISIDKLNNSDLVMSVFYDKIIKENFIDKCKKIINLHNSPLPKYRGVSPINWALKNKEKEHGVTIHEIFPGIDNGNIISQLKYSIYPEFDEVIDVYNRSLEYGYVLFKNTIPFLWKIKPQKQEESEVIYYNRSQNYLLGDRKNFTKVESK
jgi:methionyl-tRNA formyltransferase